jgi:HD-GYP domain-containing protein (c-di-GMP phosphodiesterase class II)
MTTPPRGSRFSGSHATVKEKGSEGFSRAMGRAFVVAFSATLRNLRTYPADNPVVLKSIDELAALCNEYVLSDGVFDFHVAGEFLFVNATRLRLDIETWSIFDLARETLRLNGTGQLRADRATTAPEWSLFMRLLLAPEGAAPGERHERLRARLAEAGIDLFQLTPPVHAADETSGGDDDGTPGGTASRGAYTQGVAVLRDALRALETGDAFNVKRLKRMVQLIVKRVMADEARMLGLTTVRGYADGDATHAIHVCIFSVALGRRLGLTRLQLYDLGLAALFHDAGMVRVSPAVRSKSGSLTDGDRAALGSHTWYGVLQLFQIREQQEFPYRSMVVAYQHHLRDGAIGYPRPTMVERPTLFSRIVAVAESYDSAVTPSAWCPRVPSPAVMMEELRRKVGLGLDPVVLKAVASMLGRWPVGTVVVLDSRELAVVVAANGEPEQFSRPMVRVIADEQRELPFPGVLTDLSERLEDGRYRRTVLATVDPEQYGIRVGDYFVCDD